MSKSASAVETTLGVLFVGCISAVVVGLTMVVSFATGPFYETVVANLAWKWFIAPAMGFQIPFWTLFAFNAILTVFVHPTNTEAFDKPKDKMASLKKVGTRLIMVTIMWIMLWTVHLFVAVPTHVIP